MTRTYYSTTLIDFNNNLLKTIDVKYQTIHKQIVNIDC